MSADITTQDFFNSQQSFFDQFQAGEPELGAESGKRKDNGQLPGWSNNKSLKLPPKKPGRKLDTTIPATKRKAQNRAAQRAFRERKEKHVKDLEDRVTELENEAAATNHENEFLKHQVERLQAELDKYKSANNSPRTSASAGSTNGDKAFTFEFPFFGDQQKSQAYPSPNSMPTTHAASSASESSSPFSAYKNTVSPFSSNSNDTPGSSKGGDEEETFCDKLSLACGNTDNPVPRAPSLSSDHKNSSSSASSSSNNNEANKNEASKNTEELTSLFSPPPFDFDFLGSYRDPLFENTSAEFNLPELSTTEYSVFDPLENPIVDSSFGQLVNNEPVVKQEPRDDNDEPQQTQDDEVPAPKSKFMSCSAVWDRVSSHPKFNDLDIDGLCSELQTKVKCSDSGILLTENDVEKVLSTLS